MMPEAPHADAFIAWFAVDNSAARFLAELYSFHGLTVRHDYLTAKLGVSLGSLRMSSHDLRQAMDPDSLVAIYGIGYRLTQTGLEDCRRAIADFEAATGTGEGQPSSEAA